MIEYITASKNLLFVLPQMQIMLTRKFGLVVVRDQDDDPVFCENRLLRFTRKGGESVEQNRSQHEQLETDLRWAIIVIDIKTNMNVFTRNIKLITSTEKKG